MRPVNLIPPDARRGDRAPMRTGMVSYVLMGGLAVALLMAIALAFTSKQVSDRESEIAQLEQDQAEVTAKADALKPFAEFRAVQVARTSTVAALAESRFDWDRVLNEMARVIPTDVWLLQMSGTVSPAVQLQNGPDVSIREGVAGPALEIIGCAVSQDAVAGFIADLEDIDGVTRVGVASSELSDEESAASGASSGAGEQSTDDCRTRDFISRFEIVVAFDEVPAPPGATSAPGVPAPVAPSTGGDTQLAGSSSGQPATGSAGG